MADKDGVEIYKRFYPWPDRFRLGDPVLVQQVTSMTWPEFVAAVEAQNEAVDEAIASDEEPPQPDQVVFAGLVAVAFWQGNPQMSREKARRTIERIPLEEVEVIEADEGDDAVPPAEPGVDGSSLSMISSGSAGSLAEDHQTEILPDSISGETSPNGSGSPGLPSQHPESLPA